jgi:hypothetical protein
VKEIASKLKRHNASIRKVIRNNKALPEDACALGAPESCSTGTRRGSTITSFNFRSRRPRSFKAEVPGCEKLSVRQIQFICQKRLGLPSRCASKKPLLMAKMVKKRLAFCKKYRKWTEKN